MTTVVPIANVLPDGGLQRTVGFGSHHGLNFGTRVIGKPCAEDADYRPRSDHVASLNPVRRRESKRLTTE